MCSGAQDALDPAGPVLAAAGQRFVLASRDVRQALAANQTQRQTHQRLSPKAHIKMNPGATPPSVPLTHHMSTHARKGRAIRARSSPSPRISSARSVSSHTSSSRQRHRGVEGIFTTIHDGAQQSNTLKRVRDEATVDSSPYSPFLEQAQEDSQQITEHAKRIRLSNPDLGYNFIRHWTEELAWPKEYFKKDPMHRWLAQKRSASLSRKQSTPSFASSTTGASDQWPREVKSAPYRNPSYPEFLYQDVDSCRSYARDHDLGISDTSKKLLDQLLSTEQSPPKDTLFRDDIFDKFCGRLKGKNESRIIQDLSPLLVPSVEAFSLLGSAHLDNVIESVNEGWNNCYPITKPRPQPDSSFGYSWSAFSADKLEKLRPMLGNPSFASYFKATPYMIFPFMMKEVKTGFAGLDTADNQNLHSATIAARSVIELFKIGGCVSELHREIVAFTISHNENEIRLYAHYPIVDGDEVTIWRHRVDHYLLNATTKWKTWTFTKNVFDIFSTMHLRRLCSAIDMIPSELALLSPTVDSKLRASTAT